MAKSECAQPPASPTIERRCKSRSHERRSCTTQRSELGRTCHGQLVLQNTLTVEPRLANNCDCFTASCWRPCLGEVTERPIVQHWKCCVSERGPGVRIPPSPPDRWPTSSNHRTRGLLRFWSAFRASVLWRGNSLKGQIMAVKQGSFRVGKVRGELTHTGSPVQCWGEA